MFPVLLYHSGCPAKYRHVVFNDVGYVSAKGPTLVPCGGPCPKVRDHRVEFVGLQCERGNYHP
jgi:hypothetical protein